VREFYAFSLKNKIRNNHHKPFSLAVFLLAALQKGKIGFLFVTPGGPHPPIKQKIAFCMVNTPVYDTKVNNERTNECLPPG
jgi:hypothetical protein